MIKGLEIFNSNNFLKNPGDSMSARITDTNRKVLKLSSKVLKSKYSITKYPSGTVVHTWSKKI